MPTKTTSVLWLLALSGLALAADPAGEAPADVGPVVERVEGASADELRAFEAARERFASRVQEIEGDTLAWVERQREAQLRRIGVAYDPLIEELAARETAQRGDAIAHMEGFLRRWDGVAFASDVRLRLAELYFQEADEEWLAASNIYYDAINAAGDDFDLLIELEEQGEPKVDLGNVARLLTRIIDDNAGKEAEDVFPLIDVVYYMLGFSYSEGNSQQFDRDSARATFRDLVAARPDSEYADAAHLILGNYFFEDNLFEESIPEFQAVLDRGPEHKHYVSAMYQLAWARYKLSEYDEAMRLFVALLDDSEITRRETGRESAYAQDAITYLALSLSDLADANSVTQLQSAVGFFDSLDSSRPYSWDVYVELARSLSDYGLPEAAVEVYEFLQVHPDYRFRAENPDFQNEVVTLLSRGFFADLVAAGEARLKMTERYGEGSDWWEANRTNPDALANARDYIESSLLEVAIEVRVRAQESEDPADYSAAADKYQEYLDKFPISDDYFRNQFQLADTLYKANRLEDAAGEYQKLVRNERFHEYGDVSTYMLFRTRDRIMREKLGDLDRRIEGVPVESTYTSVGGKEIEIYALTEEQRLFVEAADAVLGREYGAPVDGLDIGGIVEADRAALTYLTGQMLFYANRFDDCRPRLRVVIDRYPNTDEAAYAANLLLNSYITEGDNDQIRKWSRSFATMRLGSSEDLISEKGRHFQNTLEMATYGLGKEAFDRADYAAAAEAYLNFAEEFPSSEYVPEALLSAAFNYDRLGRASDANDLYERFIQEFPDHPDAKPFYFSIASNYEAVFQLDKAVGFYEELVRRFPDYKDAPIALYMVGFLKEGLDDPTGAAAAYERYAVDYPDVADKEEVFFRAGAQYELVSPDRALRFYRGYLRSFGTENPSHALEASQKIADLLAGAGRDRDASRALDDVVAMFDRLTAEDATIGPRGRDFAAKAAFRDVQAAYDDMVGRRWSGDVEKDAELIAKLVPADIKAFDEQVVAFIGKYLSFEYTTAAVFLQGATRAWFADNGLSVQPPDGLSDEDTDYFWEVLEEQLFPLLYEVEAQAVLKYQEVLTLARAQKRHSEWVDRAQAGLNEIKPDDYPAVKAPVMVTAKGAEQPKLVPIASTPLETPPHQPAPSPAPAPDQETP